ncbi:MAG: CorA family divalent cation transporter, partial [Myxococcales bacterium]
TATAGSDAAVFGRGLDFLLYLVSDKITDGHFLHLDGIADAIEDLEDRILTRLSRDDIEQIFALKRALVTLRKTISPARDVMSLLSKRGDPRVSERTALYFRDVYDHLVRVTEAIEADRDLLGNALDAYLSMAANRTNDIMKQLTLISVTFLPLSFITGFFGMNFTLMPFDSKLLLAGALASCILVPVSMFVWFSRKAWF